MEGKIWLFTKNLDDLDKRESLVNILIYINMTIILHNILIEMGQDEDENMAWDVVDENLTAIDDKSRIPEIYNVDQTLPYGTLLGAR